MGVVSRCGLQEVGVDSGWNLCVWLECIGVLSGCCFKVVHYIDILIIIITFPYILHLY